MKGLRTTTKTDSNQLLISIPDEFKNTDLEVIIFPVTNSSKSEIEFWTQEELNELGKIQLAKPLDEEDYTKW